MNDLLASDLEVETHRLENGLQVVLQPDSTLPLVAVNLWYHVGSKNEKFGKTGFAHLFEHLMFNGSENYNDDDFKPFSRVGATDMNGTTNYMLSKMEHEGASSCSNDKLREPQGWSMVTC